MTDQINLKKFDDIYDKTYNDVLKFIICKCSNIEDVNDIIQETYIEVYKKILKNVDIDNINPFVIGIAKNKIKKYYGLLYKFKTISIFSEKDDLSVLDKIPDDTDIEEIIINTTDIESIWNYLKHKKIEIQKIFYLYYNLDITIKEISKYLDLSESYVKTNLYRTLKELQEFLGRDS